MKKGEWLDRIQRIQLKSLAIFLGIFLLLLLFLGKLLLTVLGPGEGPNPQPAPVPRLIRNAWIMEVLEDRIRVFEEGQEKEYLFGEGIAVPGKEREQLADVRLLDEKVIEVHSKREKVNGRVLSADTKGVELEGIGRLEFASGWRGYRLYDALSMCGYEDLLIGYDFADFVMEEGKICGILMVKEDAMESIRVLIRRGNYEGLLHETVEFTCDTDYTIRYGEADNLVEEFHPAGEVCTLDEESACFVGERIWIIPSALTGRVSLLNVERSQGSPSYHGHMELFRTGEGIAVINEVLLEEYLYAVVPSEMPSSYPEEALKAQAVCARTYAYARMLHAGYPRYGAHLDDSTSYQVYNNIPEQESATTAVKETFGQLLYAGGELAETFYYSTSCGMGSDSTVWDPSGEPLAYLVPLPVSKTVMEHVKALLDSPGGDGVQSGGEGVLSAENAASALEDDRMAALALRDEDLFRDFLENPPEDDYEAGEAWYRWSYTVEQLDEKRLQELLQERYEVNESRVLTLDENGDFVSTPVTELGRVKDLYISERGAGGIAKELTIVTDRKTIRVLTEHNIRCILNDGTTKVVRRDGSEVSAPNLLPSAFLTLDVVRGEEGVEGYVLRGGGYGHGAGMSQNGARNMALDGCSAEQILAFFYRDCILKKIYEQGEGS